MIAGLRRIVSAAALAISVGSSVMATPTELLSFSDLDGWDADDHQAALTAFLETCGDLKGDDWSALCAFARQEPNAKTFFELFFRPVLIGGDAPALFTGYFEPELNGARRPDSVHRFPVYRKPAGLKSGTRWATRQQIEDQRLLAGRGLELAWVDDSVELFFLQIQGSGRIRMADGSMLRVGYGGFNGHEYKSVGQELVRRGIFSRHQVSAQVIQNWVRRNPVDGRALLQHNPSYVFFREVSRVPAEKGPLGAMNRSITTMRSVAVDPKYTPLGAPVWVEKGGRGPLKRLFVAQDTGSAIKGAQRADIFYGTGDVAGRDAGRVRDPGRMVVLLPIDRAFALVPGG